MPGFNNVDFRITRNVPIHDKIHLQIVGEAFNLLNHKIVTAVTRPTRRNHFYRDHGHCPATARQPSGSAVQGCFPPFTGTGLNAFGSQRIPTMRSYGPRQLQLSAKLTF